MNYILRLLLLCILLSSAACLIKPSPEEPDLWNSVLTEPFLNPIRNLHSSLTQLYAISDDEFIRLDNNNNLLERRQLTLPLRSFGRPVLSEQVFVRVTRQTSTDQVIEFHLSRNPDDQVYIPFSVIKTDTGDELFPEDNARYTGAFNSEGTQFMLPVLNFSKDLFTFLLFDIGLNSTNSAFTNISVSRVIDVTGMLNDPGSLNNFKFINGHYYASSLNGGFRISPDGQFSKIFDSGIFDFFSHDGKLYATGSGNDLHESSDNGLSWKRFNKLDEPSDLRFVEVKNGNVFTQRFPGFQFQLADEDLIKAKDLQLNRDFNDDLAVYTSIHYFFGRYYLSVQNQLYAATELRTTD